MLKCRSGKTPARLRAGESASQPKPSTQTLDKTPARLRAGESASQAKPRRRPRARPPCGWHALTLRRLRRDGAQLRLDDQPVSTQPDGTFQLVLDPSAGKASHVLLITIGAREVRYVLNVEGPDD